MILQLRIILQFRYQWKNLHLSAYTKSPQLLLSDKKFSDTIAVTFCSDWVRPHYHTIICHMTISAFLS